jgi:hypothetical protein
LKLIRPSMVVHADWSASAGKRWMAKARLQTDGRYVAYSAEPVGEPETLLRRSRKEMDPDEILLVGFDFPIGLPEFFVERSAMGEFLTFLPYLGEGEWQDFYNVAAQPDEIRLQRPFYPRRPGSARQSHLLNALGAQGMDDLRRRCERAHPSRRPAAPLFWTLGGQQVGKAAISGWTQVIVPALRHSMDNPAIAIWPFSGSLSDLLQPGSTVLAETYPAEFYGHLGVGFSRSAGGKRSQAARKRNSTPLRDWADSAQVELMPDLRKDIESGFGPKPGGEDSFDAVVGLFGMLNLLLGLRTLDEPVGRRLREIEGWILGQACPPDQVD